MILSFPAWGPLDVGNAGNGEPGVSHSVIWHHFGSHDRLIWRGGHHERLSSLRNGLLKTHLWEEGEGGLHVHASAAAQSWWWHVLTGSWHFELRDQSLTASLSTLDTLQEPIWLLRYLNHEWLVRTGGRLRCQAASVLSLTSPIAGTWKPAIYPSVLFKKKNTNKKHRQQRQTVLR